MRYKRSLFYSNEPVCVMLVSRDITGANLVSIMLLVVPNNKVKKEVCTAAITNATVTAIPPLPLRLQLYSLA